MTGETREQRGFTLIELMVAMVVSSIVVLGVFAFSNIQKTTMNMQNRNVRVQQALEGAMWSVAKDVRDAGLGWTRLCTELRVWDAGNGRLLNPGGVATPGDAALDAVTGEHYWVLRDGIQAHWNSGPATGLEDGGTSASPTSAADSFDILTAEANYVGAPGMFTLLEPAGGAPELRVETSAVLDSTNVDHLAQVRQLFPPGSFVILVRAAAAGELSFRSETHGQCALLQLTGDVAAGATPTSWRIPVAATSPFNSDLNALLVADAAGAAACPAANPGCDDWDPGSASARDNVVGTSVVALGRVRWSRYEIDYTENTPPYLVRYDIIGFQDGVDPSGFGAIDYPHCDAGNCPAAGLHLPGSNAPPRAIAVGPMIEDLQIAVGCDGYTAAGATGADFPIVVPDVGFGEVGPSEGPYAGIPNLAVDENSPDSGRRDRDEWLGNAVDEAFAPDCVYYGSGEYASAAWAALPWSIPPPFRHSPQTVRITLVGSSEFAEEAGGLATAMLVAVEDRPSMESRVGPRQRLTLTERFSPENLRWRDPTIQ